MHNDLRHHTSQKILDQGISKFEVGPIVPLFQNLQAVTLEIDITIEVLLMKSFHGNRLLAIVLILILVLVESKIVFNRLARKFGLLILPGGKGRGENPECSQERNINNQGKEDKGLPSSTDFPGEIQGHEREEGEEGGVGEGLATRAIRREGSIFDGWVLFETMISIPSLRIAYQWHILTDKRSFVNCEELLTEVVRTPQSSTGVVGLGAGGVSIHSKFSSEEVRAIMDML